MITAKSLTTARMRHFKALRARGASSATNSRKFEKCFPEVMVRNNVQTEFSRLPCLWRIPRRSRWSHLGVENIPAVRFPSSPLYFIQIRYSYVTRDRRFGGLLPLPSSVRAKPEKPTGNATREASFPSAPPQTPPPRPRNNSIFGDSNFILGAGFRPLQRGSCLWCSL